MNVLPPPITLVGKIHSKHGFEGKLSVECFNPNNNIISKGNYLFVIIDGKGVPFCISEVNKTKGIIKFEGVNSEDEAKSLIGLPFGVPSSKKMLAMPPVNGLIGFKIIDDVSAFAGTIQQIDELPQGLMLSVLSDSNQQIILIPLVESWINKILEDKSTIIMSLPEGLIQIND